MNTAVLSAKPSLSDEEVVDRVLAGDTSVFEVLMRRHNQRLYRACWAVLRNDSEAEDVMQEAYVRAYQHLNQFKGTAAFSTWLTRIAVNEAIARKHRLSRIEELDCMPERNADVVTRLVSVEPDPEVRAARSEIRSLLERFLADLPEEYRTVMMLRDVEEMTTAEVAQVLQISQENVKVRLHRARSMMRKLFHAYTGAERREMFTFQAFRCDRIVRKVFENIQSVSIAE